MEDKRLLAERLLADFVEKMAETVISKGRIPMAWEGFSADVNDYVTRELQLMSWENLYQTTPSLLEAGFNIVNSSWIPMYYCYSRGILDAGGGLQLEYAHLGSHAPRLPLSR